MDIEKLKRCLKCCADDNSKACNKCELEYGEEECQNLCGYAATALSTLQPSNEPLTPCDLCLYDPPSSFGGKPCSICPAVRRTSEGEGI